MQWEQYSDGYVQGLRAKLGRWEIFRVYYNSCISRTASNKYTLKCKLPGIKDTIGNFETEKRAQDMAEAILKTWLSEAKLKTE